MNAFRRLGAVLALTLAAAPAQAYVRPAPTLPGPHAHAQMKPGFAFGNKDWGHDQRHGARWLALGGWSYPQFGYAPPTVYVPVPVAVPGVETIAYVPSYRSEGPRLIVLGGRSAKRAHVPKIVYGDPL
jgi:hypothetical protein